MSIESIPQNQTRVIEKPALLPQYQYVKLTPTNYHASLVLNNAGPTDWLSFEIPGDNVINFANSFLEFYVDFTSYLPKYEDVVIANQDKMLTTFKDITDSVVPARWYLDRERYYVNNTFNIAAIRVYNQNGVNLFQVDDSYCDYIDFMRKLVHTTDDYYNKDGNYYDGVELSRDDESKSNNLFKYDNLCDAEEPDAYGEYQELQYLDDINEMVYAKHNKKYRLYFKELFNSILSLNSDIWFGEKIKIDIKFGKLCDWGYFDHIFKWANSAQYSVTNNNHVPCPNDIILTKPECFKGISVKNYQLYACYNQDAACNENTINYCLNNEIHINDFTCNRFSCQCVKDQTHFTYQFNVNSAYGSYLKYILYRNYWDNFVPVKWSGDNVKFRWMINDFPYTVDYLDVSNYDSYELIKSLIKKSIYDTCRETKFTENFFDILNFSNEKLTNMNVVCGKPLDTEHKFTFDAYNENWAKDDGDQQINGRNIHHYFYIITGRMLKIGKSGIEAVI